MTLIEKGAFPINFKQLGSRKYPYGLMRVARESYVLPLALRAEAAISNFWLPLDYLETLNIVDSCDQTIFLL